MIDVREENGGVLIRVRVVPRASKNELAGLVDGALRVRLAAPPVEGAANRACLEFMAGVLSVPKSRLKIVMGETSRSKVIFVAGMTRDQVVSALERQIT